VLATSRPSPYSIVVDSARVYWTERGTPPDLRDGAIVWCPVEGCPDAGPHSLATHQSDPHGLAVDSTAAYWGSYGPMSEIRKVAR
jgi:hypothetical protein